MKGTEKVQTDVVKELAYDAEVDSSQISVTAKGDGVVTLKGSVPTFMQKRAAERITKRIHGVKAVANDLAVVPAPLSWGDSKIAEAAVKALGWSASVPKDSVRVSVADGWMTLEGDLEWDFQRRSAYNAVRDLPGVRGVTNSIALKPKVDTGDIQEKIEESFTRNAQVDADHVRVSAVGGKVTLKGTVRSWSEREAAERVAWGASGVRSVENELIVSTHAFA